MSTKPAGGTSADTTTTVEASDATNDSKQQLSTAAAATMTPRSKLANARFDVDDILTELNETTPGTKSGGDGGANSTGSAKTAPKDVACKLFDTPTAESKGKEEERIGSSGKKKGTKRGNGASDAPEKAEPRKRRATAATANTTSPSKLEPDNEDDVDDTTDLDSTTKATSPPMAPKAGKSSTKKETFGKKASAALAQASTVALEALSGGSPAKKVRDAAWDSSRFGLSEHRSRTRALSCGSRQRLLLGVRRGSADRLRATSAMY